MKKLFVILFVTLFSLSINAQQINITITANPTSVYYGGSAVITWSSTNATSCVASGGHIGWAGTRTTSGSFYTGPLYDTDTYTITAVNATGTASDAVTIVVNPYIYINNRVVGEYTNIELPIYINGNIKKFELTIDGYPSNGYHYLEPRYFYESETFYNWIIDSYSEGQKLNIAGLGNNIGLLDVKLGTLGMFIHGSLNSTNNIGTIKTDFFDGNNHLISYWNIKVLKLPKERYYDQNRDGKENILDAENIWDSLGVSVNDTTKVLHDLDGNGERTTSDARFYLNKVVNPNSYYWPIFRDNAIGMGSIVTTPVNASWGRMADGKFGLFPTEKVTNGDLITKDIISKISGTSGLFKQIKEKIYFVINQNSPANSPILTAKYPIFGLTGKVNEGRILNISSTVTDIEEANNVPTEFSLGQNYPNPFNPTTTISYVIPTAGFVTLKVFDILGREIAELVNEEKVAGTYKVDFNASKLSSGIYIYKLTGNNVNLSKKMMLTK
jgi:hypothetical protein